MKKLLLEALYRLGFVVLRRSESPCVVLPGPRRVVLRRVHGLRDHWTSRGVADLDEPDFDAAFRVGMRMAGRSSGEGSRERLYFVTKFAEATLPVEGDLLFVGVNYGRMPHCVLSYLGVRLAAKRLILVDPYEGTLGKYEGLNDRYTTDVEAVSASFRDAPVDTVVGYAPEALADLPVSTLSFAVLDTGDRPSELLSIPMLVERLSRGGLMVLCHYAMGSEADKRYRTLLGSMPGTTINLLNGMGVFIKR